MKHDFKINRSLSEILAICNQGLHEPENRKKGDNAVRKGVTQTPITTEELLSLSPLHLYLRCYNWCLRLCYHATAGCLSWQESKASTDMKLINEAKLKIQGILKEKTGLLMISLTVVSVALQQ